MGRKKWWIGGNGPIFLVLILITGLLINGDGDVGCLFDENVCASFEENCFDDAAFGRCIPLKDTSEDDIYQYDLNPEQLKLLRKQLEKLVNEKYDWSDPFTQCVMQNALYSIRYRTKYNLRFCENTNKFIARPFTQYIEDNIPDVTEVRPLAMVNYVPSREPGYGSFANEIYYPSASLSSSLSSPISSSSLSSLNYDHGELNTEDFYNNPNIEQKPERHPTLILNNNNNNNINQISDNDESVGGDTLIIAPKDTSRQREKYNDVLYDITKPLEEQDREFDGAKDMATMFRLRRNKLRRETTRSFGTELSDYLEFLKDSPKRKQREDIDMPSMNANLFPPQINHSFDRLEIPRMDNIERLEYLHDDGEKWNKYKANEEGNDMEKEVEEDIDNDENFFSESLNENAKLLMSHDNNGFHTQNGIVHPLNVHDIYEEEQENDSGDDLPTFLWRREFPGFKRPERLDVKKPGPYFSTNNYAFKLQTVLPDNEFKGMGDKNEVGLRQRLIKKELVAARDITQLSMGDTDTLKSYNNANVDFVYIQFNEEFHKWSEGEAVVEKVRELLGMKPDDFSSIRVGRAEVTFRVNKNSQNMNAKDVVSKLDAVREKLREITNMNLIRAGIGDKTKLPPMLEVAKERYSMRSTVFGLLVATGVGVAAAAAFLTLLIARRHAKSRAKLAGLATPDPEASKDYQELCRVRMYAKQLAEKPESPRITSLSRESESNRSSTSSWNGDEAASLSNMDISTGHMVLSYMEDHLKNTNRLDQEWAAVCAYEAEPSSIQIAASESNAFRNRPGSAYPYDHSRIILNDLSNMNNLDYINASTITDHDPRNPAYIATQGPLPHTSADFWQLVWEQGSVVIVMLTRLTEEGRAMCHRYWPEEGSEHYHIYEVHLVSEHIWCDDYLVRSFYLKNLRTGETRTVTQFHFLSWPEDGVPQSTKALLEFRRKVNKSYRGRSCPIVVHCSDGAGRTGTYCLIDMVLNRMAKGAKEIDIAAALEHIRDQRPGMVAVKQQFEFVLVAVAEEVHAILKASPVQQMDKFQNSQASSVGVVDLATTRLEH